MTRDELVDKMATAIREHHTVYDPPASDYLVMASAALDVAVGELLGNADSIERAAAGADWDKHDRASNSGWDNYCYCMDQLLDRRRSLYLKPKSVEERVTVKKWALDPTRWIALVDDWNMGNTGGFTDKKDAEIYRLGLIAQLKESQ